MLLSSLLKLINFFFFDFFVQWEFIQIIFKILTYIERNYRHLLISRFNFVFLFLFLLIHLQRYSSFSFFLFLLFPVYVFLFLCAKLSLKGVSTWFLWQFFYRYCWKKEIKTTNEIKVRGFVIMMKYIYIYICKIYNNRLLFEVQKDAPPFILFIWF